MFSVQFFPFLCFEKFYNKMLVEKGDWLPITFTYTYTALVSVVDFRLTIILSHLYIFDLQTCSSRSFLLILNLCIG